MLESFHFLHPLWLLALLPLAPLAWRACRPGGDNPWLRIVDARLLPLLMVGQPAAKAGRSMLWLLASAWLIATLALADPTWERKPQPVFQTSAARVVVLDLSSSMNAGDLKPSRLARARYKVDDLLSLGAEGQTGLVVYAGDAFTVTPLTRDANTIRAQLDALAPNLMPSDGSRADLGLLKAEELLRQAGASTGQVLLIADAVAPDALAATEQAAARLKRDGYAVSVLGVGVGTGASGTSPDAQGAVGHGAVGHGDPALAGAPHAETARLRSIAQSGGGVDLSVNDGIDAMRSWVDTQGASQVAGTERSDLATQGWKEEGPLIALLLLPLGALAFRRNWLLSVMLLPLLVMHPHEAMASTWSDLWQRQDQQAARSLSAGDYAKAAQLATDADRRGSAEYKRGNYQQALDDFAQSPGAEADYNRGNALARLGKYADAISAYDKALQASPGHADARFNKSAVEALLKQQQQKDQQEQPQQKGQQQQKEQGKNGKESQPSGQEKTGQEKTGQEKSDQAKSGGEKSGAGRSGQQNPGSKGEAQQNNAGQGDGKSASGQGSPGAQGHPSPGQPAPAPQSAATNPGTDAKGAADTAGSAQKKPGNEFADAAKQLAAQAAQGTKGGPDNTGPTASPTDPAAAGSMAGAKPGKGPAGASGSAQPLPTEEQLAAEQWLRRIPDDPGGLLRRKFLYQYRQRAQQAAGDSP